MTTENVDVVIIGAGIVGCSIAFALSKRGFGTINVDGLPAAGYGSTSHSSAIVRPIYSHVTSCAIAHESRNIWLQWQQFLGAVDERGYAVYTECGVLVLLREGEENTLLQSMASMDEVDIEYSRVSREEICRIYPGVSLESYGPPRQLDDEKFGLPTGGTVTGGMLVPNAGYVNDPQLASHNLQVAAEAHGAEFRFNCKVTEINRDSDAVTGVRFGSGDSIEAKIVINAAGPHSGPVNELAGIRKLLPIDTKALRNEVVYLKPPSPSTGSARVLFDIDAGIYRRPDGADILIGSTDPSCDPPDIVDPDDFNESFTQQWTLQAYRAAQRFPNLGISNTARGTVGLYDVTGDWIPIYDKTDLPGYYLAIGTSGNQFKNAPLIGEIMARIIDLETRGIDHDTSPAFLELFSLKRSVSLDFFSRNRTLQATDSVFA